MTANPTQAYPCLFYRDAPAAMDWLAKAFGFKQIMAVPNDNGGIAHAEMALGDLIIMPSTARPDQGWKSPLDLKGATQQVYVYIADIKAHHDRAKAAGAEITIPYEEKDYGGAGYTARDIEGHEWSFGSYRPSPNGEA